MKNFKFKVSSEFEDTIDKVISCLLPHENFDVDEAKSVVEELQRTLPIEETSGIYYIFLKIIHRLEISKLYFSNYTTVLRRELVENAVLSSIENIVLSDEFSAQEFFAAYGKTFNLDIPQQKEEALSMAYTEVMSKYDELFDLAIPTKEGLTWVNILKDSMEHGLTSKMLSIAAQILSQGRTEGRRTSRGAADARKFLADALADVNHRVTTVFSDVQSPFTPTALDSYEAVLRFRERNKTVVRDLYYTGITPIDDLLPIRTQDIVTIVADEGTGKTRLMVDQVYRALISGVNVLYVCGETPQDSFQYFILSRHLFERYGLQLSVDEIKDPTRIKDISFEVMEDVALKIKESDVDLSTNPAYGVLHPVQNVPYEDFESTISQYCEGREIDLVIVDHVLALHCTGAYTTSGRLDNNHSRVNFLYECENRLVKRCSLAFINISHPSSTTSADLRAGKAPGSRAGAESAASARYSSIVFVLGTNDDFKAKDLVKLYVTKMRNAPCPTQAIVLKRSGSANKHEYDEKLQYLGRSGDVATDNSTIVDLFTSTEDNT